MRTRAGGRTIPVVRGRPKWDGWNRTGVVRIMDQVSDRRFTFSDFPSYDGCASRGKGDAAQQRSYVLAQPHVHPTSKSSHGEALSPSRRQVHLAHVVRDRGDQIQSGSAIRSGLCKILDRECRHRHNDVVGKQLGCETRPKGTWAYALVPQGRIKSETDPTNTVSRKAPSLREHWTEMRQSRRGLRSGNRLRLFLPNRRDGTTPVTVSDDDGAYTAPTVSFGVPPGTARGRIE